MDVAVVKDNCGASASRSQAPADARGAKKDGQI